MAPRPVPPSLGPSAPKIPASRQAGTITAASAVPIPMTSATTSTVAVCRVASGIVTIWLTITRVMINARIAARKETTIASSDSSRRIVGVVAPRTRNSACSLRRRSPPVALTAKVRMIARMAPGSPEEEKENSRVQSIFSYSIESSSEIVRDDRAADDARLEVVRELLHVHVRIARIVRERVTEPHVQLRAHRPGSDDRLLIEPLVPHIHRNDEHVVRRSLRRRAGRNTDRLKERVGLGKIDYPVDPRRHRWQTHAGDGDGIAHRHVKIRRRLLRDQNSLGGPEHRPQQPGEILPVRGRDAEHLCLRP